MYTYNLGLRFSNMVKENLQKTAIKFCDNSSITFFELDSFSNQIVHFLLEQGIEKQQVIAIQNEKTAFGFASMLACIKIGVIYTNFDFANPKERIRKIFQTCRPKFVLTDNQINENVLYLCNEMQVQYFEYVDKTVKKNIINQPSAISKDILQEVTGENPAYIMFTSGSTGTPKGVLIKQESVLNLIEWGKETYSLTLNDIMTNVNPIYFDNSVFDFYCALFNGITLIAFSKEVVAQPKLMLEIVEREKCTFWFSVPSFLIYLYNLRLLSEKVFQFIRIFSFGGEGYPKEQLVKLYNLYQEHAEFYNVYGPTEGTCICSAYRISQTDFEDSKGLVTLGKIANNFHSFILDKEDQISTIGELCLLGTQLAVGYYNDQERTEKSFVQNPFNNKFNEKMYRTGDLVEEKEGKLYFKGRIDNQIKHMGYRIELEEIENGLMQISYVKQCAVVHGKTANGFSKIVAYIATDLKLEQKEIRVELRKYLPEYMIPNYFETMQELPKNANGKVDRIQLKELILKT